MTIIPVLIRQKVITSFDEPLATECLQIVRACKTDLEACLAGSPPEKLRPAKYLVIVPYGAGDVLKEAFNEVVDEVEHCGNEPADGYEDSRYWTCVIAGNVPVSGLAALVLKLANPRPPDSDADHSEPNSDLPVNSKPPVPLAVPVAATHEQVPPSRTRARSQIVAPALNLNPGGPPNSKSSLKRPSPATRSQTGVPVTAALADSERRGQWGASSSAAPARHWQTRQRK